MSPLKRLPTVTDRYAEGLSGRPLYPGDDGAHPAAVRSTAGIRRFPTAVPDLGPVPLPFHPDLQDDEASTKGSLAFARPSFPFTRGPRKEQGPFGLHPGLRTPQLPAAHAGEGTGLRARTGDHVTIGNLHDVIHSPHATSCRTRTVLPSMATAGIAGTCASRVLFLGRR